MGRVRNAVRHIWNKRGKGKREGLIIGENSLCLPSE